MSNKENNTNNTNVTKQNKSDLGMNRNDFFEYKKNRMVELAREGASVGDMANALGMEERDVYAFLSRNFGGLRRLREMASSGDVVPQMKMAAMTTEKVDEPKTKTTKQKSITKAKKSSAKDKPVSVFSSFLEAFQAEKEKLFNELRADMEREIQSVIEDTKNKMASAKEELLGNFKNEVMSEISNIGATL